MCLHACVCERESERVDSGMRSKACASVPHTSERAFLLRNGISAPETRFDGKIFSFATYDENSGQISAPKRRYAKKIDLSPRYAVPQLMSRDLSPIFETIFNTFRAALLLFHTISKSTYFTVSFVHLIGMFKGKNNLL